MIQIPTGPVPDALMIPARYRRGRGLAERLRSIAEIAGPILRVDHARGEQVHLRDQRHEIFATKDRADTIKFPINTPFRGKPRYRWVEGPDGIRRGYLTELAREYKGHEPAFDPIAIGLTAGVCRYGY